MSGFADEAFRLNDLQDANGGEALPPGGLSERHQALLWQGVAERYRRLQDESASLAAEAERCLDELRRSWFPDEKIDG